MICVKDNFARKPTENQSTRFDRSAIRRTRVRSIKIIACAWLVVLFFIGSVAGQQSKSWTVQRQREFLKQHWRTPIPPQGKPPAGFSELETSLDPASCGVCHQTQYDDWSSTVHSRAVGPGLLGQTPTFIREEPGTAVMCYACHAPLSEQQEVLESGSDFVKNTGFDASLQKQGLTCAACHVRGYQRFGPPQTNGSLQGDLPSDLAPHGGATRTPAFDRAEFCAGCHQFNEDDRALNGKLMENTYNEWKNGPYSKQGISCQHCHMPDRRHLWRGIHDPEMVKKGVKVTLATGQSSYRPGQRMTATLTLTNAGVGHYFPTYVTPRVVLRLELVDAKHQAIATSVRTSVVGREVALDLSREIADTRIPPKGRHTFRYAQTVSQRGLTLRATVTVYPDEFYRRFYEAKLSGDLSTEERNQLHQAHEHAQRSSYTLFQREIPIS